VDVRLDENGQPNFIEANPLPGLNPRHSDLPILCRLRGLAYESLIGAIMNSALARYGLESPTPAKNQARRHKVPQDDLAKAV
jgi:D-alanine-D-alanine ligase